MRRRKLALGAEGYIGRETFALRQHPLPFANRKWRIRLGLAVALYPHFNSMFRYNLRETRLEGGAILSESVLLGMLDLCMHTVHTSATFIHTIGIPTQCIVI